MGRAQIKKKSVFIDMTAMSDVTVLLLTFFMLTSHFVKKEPVQVATPKSVSQIKIPEKNVLSILIDPKGRIFMGLDKKADMADVLQTMGQENHITFTDKEIQDFSIMPTFGMPISQMQAFLSMSTADQDVALKDAKNPGIPNDSLNNEFKEWVKIARQTNPDLRIAIKADQKTPYSVIKKVMNSLQDLRENRYNLITDLKEDPNKNK
jgi:biopolymer transport protein ExbD